MTPHASDQPARFSASHLPPDADPAEKDFVRLLERALAPSFTLVKRLGAGGMGAVYLARDPVLKRHVAVKVMAPSLAADAAARARFEREAQAVASISHPNVVSVYSVGELENGVPYLVMQYIEGNAMSERLKESGPLDVRAAKRILGEVASALAAAHRKGIIHRDIKPENILWDDDTGRALVTDFGIAAVLERGDERDATRITHTGMSIGTPAYMSPEQLLAEPITEKTDIYSLGLLAYELLIGEGPYRISSPREMMAAHLRDTPRPLSSMRADVDPELDRLLEACLAKDPKQRPSARDVESRLMHGASVLLEWPPPGLEPLGASLRSAIRVLLLGAFATGIPVVALSVFDRESLVRQSLPPTLALLGLTAIGFLTFCVGLLGLAKFFRQASKAVALGYGWGTVIEAAGNQRGDTGALIAGGREYAELAPETRNVMRRNRIIATVCQVLAGLAPVFGYALGVFLAGRSASGPTIVLWSSILLALTLLAVSRLIGWQEDRAMREARRRIRTAVARSEGLHRLAEIWNEAFAHVRVGQKLGPGPSTRSRSLNTILGAAIILGGLAGFGVFLILLLTTGIGTAAATSFPKFANTRQKIVRIQRLSQYRVSPDTAVSALRAGEALHAIVRNGPGGPLLRFERAPAIAIPPQPEKSRLSDPFPNPAVVGWRVGAFARARRGFSSLEREFLQRTADNTALEEFRIVAHAPSLDFAGAYWDIQPGAEPRWYDLPIPRFATVRAAADANTAQAALDFAAGRPQDAELRLREVISVGFLMVENGHTLIENLFGAVIVATARESLGALFDATGRARDARFVSKEQDPVITIITAEGPARVGVDDLSRELRRIILDDTEVLGLRWEMLLGSFVWEPCADMHQVMFGPDSLHRATVAEARKRLVKRPSDALLFGILERTSDQPVPYDVPRARGTWAAHRSIARIARALTGSRQLEGCLSLIP